MSSHPNLNFNVTGQGATTPVEGTEAPQQTPTAPPPSPVYQSSIAPSAAEQVEESLNASIPMIPYPILMQFFDELGLAHQAEGIDGVSAGHLWDLKQSEVVLDILTKWNDSIKEEIAERRAIESSPTEIRKNEEKWKISDVLDTVIASAKASPDTAKDLAIPLVVVGLIFAGTGGVVDGLFLDTVSTDLVGVNPSRNQAPNTAVYHDDMRAELGLLGASMLIGASYMANKDVVLKIGSNKPNEDITAKSYADQIFALVSSGALTTLVQAIVAKNTEAGKPIDQGLVRTLETQMKLILLSSALAALYKAAPEGGTGWIKQGDFLGLLSGENETFGPNKETMDKILSQMDALFATLPDKGVSLKASLALFFDQNPNLSVLTNPAKLFSELKPYVQKDPGQSPA